MSLKNVKLEVKKVFENANTYTNFYRGTLYKSERAICPGEVYYTEDITKQIDGQLLGKRLGLMVFRLKDDHKFEELEHVEYVLENQSDKTRWIQSKQLISPYVEPVDPEEILLALEKHTKCEIKVRFVQGDGYENARFSLFEGFRFKDLEDKMIFQFETMGQLDLNKMKELIAKQRYSYENFKELNGW